MKVKIPSNSPPSQKEKNLTREISAARQVLKRKDVNLTPNPILGPLQVNQKN